MTTSPSELQRRSMEDGSSNTSGTVICVSRTATCITHVEWAEIAASIRTARADQRAIERDRVAVARRAPPVQRSGGFTYPARPRR